MAEYIERDKTCEDCVHYGVCYHIELYGRDIETDEPCAKFKSADVVEIVRCENCKHFHEYPYKGTNDPSGWGKCKQINMDIDLTINDFCSYGERKCEDG